MFLLQFVRTTSSACSSPNVRPDVCDKESWRRWVLRKGDVAKKNIQWMIDDNRVQKLFYIRVRVVI